MKKLFVLGLALMVLCAILTSTKMIAADEEAAMAIDEVIVLPASNGDVTFNHKTHCDPADAGGMGVACNTCHHTVKEGETPKSCSSEECHSATSTPKIRDAFHQQCYKGCHKTKNAEEGKTAPTKCSACHIKKEE